ncbi:hypothetical protein B857_00816 [Solibacillus isronensis B3W22]|uniref:Uncharacterized protein n=1 Tax=Solibacillus isronensis B3W22 TaxID=1224748 RepID=K1KVM8_9BACL|nr:hypothetical protein [Solibacillus isronensis]AMO85937.1 hypothetical protein SOLI23_10155 [Solibacillus silvestris]EKB46606.1 hypothetical protein B857_00816 [Solibacillus isronensis B3W22]
MRQNIEFAPFRMKLTKVVNYLVYTGMVSLIGYSCYFISMLFIGSMLFTAADAPPGDISNSGRLLTIAFQAFGTFIVLLIYSIVHWSIASLLNIPFPKRFIFILNLIVISLVTGALILKFIIINGSFL